jgi:hypothetical protein
MLAPLDAPPQHSIAYGHRPARRIAIIVRNPAEWAILKCGVIALRQSTDFTVHLIFYDRYINWERDYADAASLDVPREVYPPPEEPALAPAPPVRSSRVHLWVTRAARVVPWLSGIPLLRRIVLRAIECFYRWRRPGDPQASVTGLFLRKRIADLLHDFFDLKGRLFRIQLLIERLNPELIILAEDEITSDSHLFFVLAQRARIATVVLPFTIPNPAEAAESFRYAPAHDADGGINRLFAQLFPKWIFEHRGRRIIRLPWRRVLALEAMGLATERPWTLNFGGASSVAVESEEMRERYVALGFPPSQIVVAGSPIDDVIADVVANQVAYRRKLDCELQLTRNRPILLCAFPPDQTSFEGRLHGFRDYAEIVEFWMKHLTRMTDHFEVVIRLHPRLKKADFEQFEQPGLRLCDWMTAAVVPLCDVYVASISSTIRWAIACGKPVLNYDVYQLRYDDFGDAPGVVTVYGKDEFADTLDRFADPTFRVMVAARQSRSSEHWGCLDGKSGARLRELVGRLVASRLKAI